MVLKTGGSMVKKQNISKPLLEFCLYLISILIALKYFKRCKNCKCCPMSLFILSYHYVWHGLLFTIVSHVKKFTMDHK